MSDMVTGRQGFWLTGGEFILWLAAFLNPVFAFVLGSAYLFYGNEIFAPQTPTEYGKSIILVGLIGAFSTLLWIILIVVMMIAVFNVASASLPPFLRLPFQQ